MTEEFKEQIIYRLDESIRMVTISFDELSEEDIWKRSNESSNCIGNLILHLCGNVTQYILASLGNKEDKRDRDSEFEIKEKEGYTKKVMLLELKNTVEKAKQVISACTVSELMRKREVQGFLLSGIGIAIHVVEHLSYHTGQIAFWTKQLKNKDLDFYEGMNLNAKNK